MEALTRLVTDSLTRHGFDRPVDPRRLQWSRWFRCESPHSLLIVPSRPGIFAIAEEVAALCGASEPRSRNPERSAGSPVAKPHVGTSPQACPEPSRRGCPAEPSSAIQSTLSICEGSTNREGRDFSSKPAVSKRSAPLGGAALQRCDSPQPKHAASAAEVPPATRMLAVLQFSEDDDMAFTLDRMFIRINPMRARLTSGNCFLRFVVIEDQDERRSICSALNQWLLSSVEKASGIPAGFSSSLEMSAIRVAGAPSSPSADTVTMPAQGSRSAGQTVSLPYLNSGANNNLHCPHPLPSGF